MTVYLLHFDSRINPNHPCRHYIGYTGNGVLTRLEEHAAGRGARLCAVALERGIGFTLARLWKGETRTFERTLKNRKMAPRLCPICSNKLRWMYNLRQFKTMLETNPERWQAFFDYYAGARKRKPA